MDYSKNLESKISNVQKDLELAQEQNAEMQKTLERTKSINEFATIDLQQQLKTLQREKEEIIKRENTKIKVINDIIKSFHARYSKNFLNFYRMQRLCMKIHEFNTLKKCQF